MGHSPVPFIASPYDVMRTCTFAWKPRHRSPPQNHNRLTGLGLSESMMTVSRFELAWDSNLRPSGLILSGQTDTSKVLPPEPQLKKSRFTGSLVNFRRLRDHATPLIGWRMFLRLFSGPTTSKRRVLTPLK